MSEQDATSVRTGTPRTVQAWVQWLYFGSAILLTLWSIAFGILAAIDESGWWAFLVLPGLAIILGLLVERRKAFPVVLLVLGSGAFIGVITFWTVFAPILAVLLLASRFWIGRGRVLQRARR